MIGRDHLDSGSVASPNRETEAMQDGSDAVSDWPLLNALLNTASGATWVSFHHGGGVGMGYSQHAGVVIVCDGSDAAATRIERVLWNDPGTGVMRHADAGYDDRPRLRAAARAESADGGALMLLRPGALTLDDLQALHAGGRQLRMDPQALPAIVASAEVVRRAAEGDAAVYGVNTGFGKLASTRISEADLATLQLNLIRSHSVGVGAPLTPAVVRLMLATKAASLARGHSGVRPAVIDSLLAVHNAGLVPYVPSQGSVGASGDLAPLSHMTLALLGEGEFLEPGPGASAVRRPAAEVLREAGIAPLVLSAKEGLALINGTQTSTALALHALFSFEPVLESALVIGALTVDAARGSDGPFDPRIHALRGQPGQIDVAQYYRSLLAGSAIRRSHLEGDDRVQDPYSLRCQPQVVGACLDQLRHAALVLLREANAVTDNPLVFVAADGSKEHGALIAGGNFHAEPVALACDAMANAIAEVGAIAERRIAMLIDSNVSRLPPFLTAQRRPEQRLHDRPRHRGGAGEREQVARPPGQRRQPADEREPGRPRLDGHLRGAPAAADDRQRRAHPRHRVAGRGAGHRVPAPADELAAARGRAPAAAPGLPGDGRGPFHRARHRGGDRARARRLAVDAVPRAAGAAGAVDAGLNGRVPRSGTAPALRPGRGSCGGRPRFRSRRWPGTGRPRTPASPGGRRSRLPRCAADPAAGPSR